MRKNKIRILHVAQAAGGVDRYIRMLLKYLDKEKFENILVCSQDFHEEDYRGLADSFEQVEMTRAIGGNDLKAIREVRALIKKYNPNIVYEKEYDRLMAELNDEPAYYKEQLLMLESRYLEKKSVVDFISTTISGMDEKTSLVARMLWIEDQGWDAIADALHVRSHTTISRIKDKAIVYMAGVLEERENNKLRIMLG